MPLLKHGHQQDFYSRGAWTLLLARHCYGDMNWGLLREVGHFEASPAVELAAKVSFSLLAHCVSRMACCRSSWVICPHTISTFCLRGPFSGSRRSANAKKR